MQISRLPQQSLSAAAVTIGNFDGVHLGHQQILRRLTRHAQKNGLLSVVLIFEPQPREFLCPDDAPARLSSLADKVRRFTDLNIDRLVILPFNAELRSLSADEFVQRVLIEKLNTQWLQVGDDFRFGADRKGNVDFLKQYHFEVTDLPSQCIQGHRISSTKIRHLIADADFDLAQEFLGEPFTLSGRVIYGQQLGRTIGVPTANLLLPHKKLPIDGVFAVTAEYQGKTWYGVANLGTKPTVGDLRHWLEVHFFDFNAALYGERLSVHLHKRLRGTVTFDNLGALKTQIQLDIQASKAWFAQSTKVKYLDD